MMDTPVTIESLAAKIADLEAFKANTEAAQAAAVTDAAQAQAAEAVVARTALGHIPFQVEIAGDVVCVVCACGWRSSDAVDEATARAQFAQDHA